MAASLSLALVPLLTPTGAGQAATSAKVRWDITNLDFATTPPTARAGGQAFARATDGSRIALSGRGTFRTRDPDRVSGGGRWTTFGPAGNITASGTYRVTELASWRKAPGQFPISDGIGRKSQASAGLAVLEVLYSNRRRGTLVVSCHLDGTPDSLFEGVTATMGFAPYWNPEMPKPGVNANRTLFHVTR